MIKESNFITENLEFSQWYLEKNHINDRMYKSIKDEYYTLKFMFNGIEYDFKLTQNKYEELRYEFNNLRRGMVCKLEVSYRIHYYNTNMMANILCLENFEVVKNGEISKDHEYLNIYSIDKGIFSGIKWNKDGNMVWDEQKNNNNGQGYVQVKFNNSPPMDFLIKTEQASKLIEEENITVFDNQQYIKYIKFSLAKRSKRNGPFVFLFDQLSDNPFVEPLNKKKKASSSVEHLMNLENEYCNTKSDNNLELEDTHFDIDYDRLPF